MSRSPSDHSSGADRSDTTDTRTSDDTWVCSSTARFSAGTMSWNCTSITAIGQTRRTEAKRARKEERARVGHRLELAASALKLGEMIDGHLQAVRLNHERVNVVDHHVHLALAFLEQAALRTR